MAKASHKITEFPGSADLPDPITALPAGLLSQDRDPTREIRNLIDALQAAAREARRRQRQAEEEREILRTQLVEMEEKLESEPQNGAKMKALVRERDVLLEQQAQYGPTISDLKQRLKRAETELREASDERNAAEREQKNLKRMAEDAEKRRAEAVRQKESATRQFDLLKDERTEALEKAALHKKNFTDAQKALAEAQKALAEARKELASAKKKGDTDLTGQLSSLRQARDGMSEQIKKLKQQVSDLEDQNAEAGYAREAAERQARESQSQLADLKSVLESTAASTDAQRIEHLESTILELQSQLASAQQAGEAAAATDANLSQEIAELKARLEAATQTSSGQSAFMEEAEASLAEAHAQVELLARERDAIRAELAQRKAEFESQLNEQAAEVERFALVIHENQSKATQRGELESLFEKRRLEMIELNAKLENAQREIRDLSASLAEARLEAKRSKRGPASAASHGPEKPAQVSQPADKPAKEHQALAVLRNTCQTLGGEQLQPGVLAEMEKCSRTILEHAVANGLTILRHACSEIVNLLAEVSDIPGAGTKRTLRTLNQGIEFVALLLSDPGIENRIRLEDTAVYVVDDDAGSCAAAVDGLGLLGVCTNLSENSGNAIVELSSMKCDLIILDVHLPELDGFELASQIRTMEPHRETPLFFVTGDSSPDTRTKSSAYPFSEFILKPYSLHELALLSLKAIVTRRLRNHA